MPEPSNQPAGSPASGPTPSQGADGLDTQKRSRNDPLRQEKKRLALQYSYKWWELLWDKLIFAAFLAVFGGAGYFLANKALEQFKTQEAGKRSLLEQQMPELFRINSAMSEVTRVYFAHAGGQKVPNEQKVRGEYKAALDKAREAINRSTFLFDVDFNKDVDRYYAVHGLLQKLPPEKWGKYKEFAEALSNSFDDLCRSVVEGQRGNPKTRTRMPLLPISTAERENKPPEEALDLYLDYWKNPPRTPPT